jgi:hypothetical protein
VNDKLIQHGEMRLVPESTPGFVGKDDAGYGFRCRVEGIFDSHIPLVVTEEALFIAGSYRWSEGTKILIQWVTIEAVADALADGVRWTIEG